MRPIYIMMFLVVSSQIVSHSVRAEPSRQNLESERLLHTGDIFTPEVLQKEEWFYGQPPILLPGWSMWGITDRITIELDYMAWLRGIPDFNVRYSLTDPSSKGFALAWETMGISFSGLPEDLNFDSSKRNLFINRHGAAGYSRLIAGTWLNDRVQLMGSVGASYSERYRIEYQDGTSSHGSTFHNFWEPVGSISTIYRMSPGSLFFLNASYGETFIFAENRPRKEQITWGFTFHPFRQTNWGGWRNLHLELTAWYQKFRDADYIENLPIPIAPYLYWQWPY